MKKVIIAICLSLAAVWSVGAMAEDIAVVNMQTVFRTSPQAKSINTALKKQFSARKAGIVKMGQQLQAEVQKYQKNQTTMSKASLAALQQKISMHSAALRQSQSKFQSDLIAAQNKKMKAFLNRVKIAVSSVAKRKGLDLVLPSNAVLYSKSKLDVTSSVLSAMR